MKTKISPLFDALSGKMGNIVASNGRGGSYLRARVIPANPNSTSQVTARNRITTLSQAWSGLTENQRTQWNNSVSEWKSTGIFGDKLTPSGFNLYMQLNANLAVIGVAAMTVPPAKAAVAALTTLSATQVHAGATTLTFTATPAPAGSSYIIEATEPMSAGRNFVGSQYRVLEVMAAAQTSPRVITTVYAAKFGGPGNAGEKVFFRVRAINSTTGQAGGTLTCSAVVS
jgi:hypothetical protein